MRFNQMTVLVALFGHTIATGYDGGAGGATDGYGDGAGGSAGGVSYGGKPGRVTGFEDREGEISYGGGAGASRVFSAGRGKRSLGGFSGGIVAAPQPYSFDYNAADSQGNSHYRKEEEEQNGNVRGTYGYPDARGLYTVVEYVADVNGFRANIRTNQPGTDGMESPADVVLTTGIQDRWTSAGGTGYGGGAGSGAEGSYGGGAAAGASGFSGGARDGARVRSGKSGY